MIYKVKQNGAKVSFVFHFSFFTKFISTCICIDTCLANSRPILCLGSKSGEVQIYYIDEPAPELPRDNYGHIRQREKQHEASPIPFVLTKQASSQKAADLALQKRRTEMKLDEELEFFGKINSSTNIAEVLDSVAPALDEEILDEVPQQEATA